MKKLEKLISNLSKHWGISPEAVVDRLNDMDKSELNKIVNQMTKKFQNGGLIDCLQKGGKYSECKKCGGKVVKNQEPAGPLRARGTRPSSAGIFAPDMERKDDL